MYTRRDDAMQLDDFRKAPPDENQAPETNLPTPKTPRHRDALSKHPTTPRHRIAVGNKCSTPGTGRTPSTPAVKARSVYSGLRKLFTRGSNAGIVIGRGPERLELSDFITTRKDAVKGGCLYVSGPPGTGKSALVTEVCKQYKDTSTVRQAYVNCMSIKNVGDIHDTLLANLGEDGGPSDKSVEETLKHRFLNRKDKTTYLVTLDEIDVLLNLDLSILYSLFEWAFAPNSRLILIGIANALDLTDRFLPRLKARNLKPSLLPFLPYTAAEVSSVLTARCRSLLPYNSTEPTDFVPILHPSAIQLISKKVASQSGDLRKSFDIAQRVIDLIETETRSKFSQAAPAQQIGASPILSPLTDNPNLATPSPSKPLQAASSTQSIQDLTPQTAPRATLAHVIRVTSAAFNNGVAARLEALNLQQKAVLCALVALETRNRSAISNTLSPPQTPEKISGKRANQTAPTIRALAHAYNSLCQRDNVIHALGSTEFRDVVSSLETASLVASGDGKGGSLAGPSTPSKRGRGTGFGTSGDDKRVSASVGLKDLRSAVEGPGAGVLRSILSGEGLES